VCRHSRSMSVWVVMVLSNAERGRSGALVPLYLHGGAGQGERGNGKARHMMFPCEQPQWAA
jgi:hypothetical protein